MQTADEEIRALKKRTADMEYTIRRRDERKNSLQNQRDTLFKTIDALRNDSHKKDEQIQQLNSHVSILRGNSKKKNTDIYTLTHDLNTANNKIATLEHIAAAKIDKHTTLIQQLEDYKRGNAIKDMRVINLRKDNESLRTASSEKDTHISTLQTNLKKLDAAFSEAKRDNAKKDAHVSSLEAELERQKYVVEILKQQKEGLESQTTSLKAQIQELHSNSLAKEIQAAALSSGLDEAKTALSELQADIAAKESAISNLESFIEDRNNSIAALSSQITTLSSQPPRATSTPQATPPTQPSHTSTTTTLAGPTTFPPFNFLPQTQNQNQNNLSPQQTQQNNPQPHQLQTQPQNNQTPTVHTTFLTYKALKATKLQQVRETLDEHTPLWQRDVLMKIYEEEIKGFEGFLGIGDEGQDSGWRGEG